MSSMACIQLVAALIYFNLVELDSSVKGKPLWASEIFAGVFL